MAWTREGAVAGGKKVQALGKGHRWNREAAAAAGRKGAASRKGSEAAAKKHEARRRERAQKAADEDGRVYDAANDVDD